MITPDGMPGANRRFRPARPCGSVNARNLPFWAPSAQPSTADGATARRSRDVQGLAPRGLAGRIQRDLFDPRLGLAQQLVAPALEGLAPFVDGDRFLQRHIAALELLHDRFEL